jgi:stage V sporulation protein G
MEITEVRIKLMDEPGERLKAFCSITFDDCFVVRDLKIIEGTSGPFVAMPSRKLTAHCPSCGTKNHLRAPYCNQCSAELPMDRTPVDADGRAKLYADIAHPINSGCREMIQECVIREYQEELQRAQQPGYISRYDDFDVDYNNDSKRHSSASNSSASNSNDARVDEAHRRPVPPPKRGRSSPNTPRPHNPGQFGAGIFGDSDER